jgi:hypothetical protein
MDHIPKPRDPARQLIQVPYLATGNNKYDDLGFSGFPERKGFDVERLRRAEFQQDQWDDVLLFLQEWFFFGMLREVLGGSGLVVDIEDFVRQADGQRFITTQLLPYYLRLWASHENSLEADAKEESLNRTDRRFAKIHRCINSITYAWGCLEAEQTPSEDQPSQVVPKIPLVAREMLLSIIILGESLSYGRYLCYGVEIPRPFIWTRCWFLDEWMLDAGWCRYEITRIEDKHIHINMCSYYFSLLDRTSLDKNHHSCSWEYCLADQVDVETYRTRHVYSDCACGDAVEDEVIQQVRRIILEQKTPGLTIAECGKEISSGEIKIHQVGPTTRYAAISHVWSDGLGNNKRNSLPICQLRRLQMLVDDLYEFKDRPVPFWIDTICVPLEPLERKAAIIGLKRTYEEADKVLVLDNTLQMVTNERKSTETLMRVASSSWIRRLWTFQEGALSRSLHFQFANKATTYADISAQRQEETVDHFSQLCVLYTKRRELLERNALNSELKAFIHNISAAEDPIFFEADRHIHEVRTGYNEAETECTRLVTLYQNMKWRTTSRLNDEFICLANLLGRNIEDVMSCSQEEKMKWLFSSLSYVPASIIFHDRPRIEEPGYRWIPRTILNSGTDSNIGGDSQITSPSSNGLTVTYPGLLLFPNSDFYVSNPHSPLYLQGTNQIYLINIIEKTTVSREHYRSLQLAMIFEDFADRSMEYVPKARAILVVISKREPTVIFARIELSLLFERMAAGSGSSPPHACHITAQALQRDQIWCVG